MPIPGPPPTSARGAHGGTWSRAGLIRSEVCVANGCAAIRRGATTAGPWGPAGERRDAGAHGSALAAPVASPQRLHRDATNEPSPPAPSAIPDGRPGSPPTRRRALAPAEACSRGASALRLPPNRQEGRRAAHRGRLLGSPTEGTPLPDAATCSSTLDPIVGSGDPLPFLPARAGRAPRDSRPVWGGGAIPSAGCRAGQCVRGQGGGTGRRAIGHRRLFAARDHPRCRRTAVVVFDCRPDSSTKEAQRAGSTSSGDPDRHRHWSSRAPAARSPQRRSSTARRSRTARFPGPSSSRTPSRDCRSTSRGSAPSRCPRPCPTVSRSPGCTRAARGRSPRPERPSFVRYERA